MEFHEVAMTMPLSLDMDSFCASNINKQKLEVLMHDMITETADQKYKQCQIVCSEICGEIVRPCTSIFQSRSVEMPELHSSIDEADERLVLHVNNALGYNYKAAVIQSSDSDVSILLLHFWALFQEKGL